MILKTLQSCMRLTETYHTCVYTVHILSYTRWPGAHIDVTSPPQCKTVADPTQMKEPTGMFTSELPPPRAKLPSRITPTYIVLEPWKFCIHWSPANAFFQHYTSRKWSWIMFRRRSTRTPAVGVDLHLLRMTFYRWSSIQKRQHTHTTFQWVCRATLRINISIARPWPRR